MKRRTTCRPWLAVWIIAASSGVGLADNEPLRLSTTRPESGWFVETPRGYMLPYTATIPGSMAKFEMVPVPGGTLICERSDGELATIVIEPFWIGKFEVTWHEYAGYMSLSTDYRRRKIQSRDVDLSQPDAVTAPTIIYDVGSRLEFATSPNRPAATMSQYSARQYTKWLSILLDEPYRLPSEAEWTYACLAPADNAARLPATDLLEHELKQIAVFGQATDGSIGPELVGSRKANAFGIHDMLGNVSEWVLDSQPPKSEPIDSLPMKTLLLHLEAGNYSVRESLGVAQTRFAAVACGGGCWSPVEQCQPTSRIVADEALWALDPDYPPSVSWMADFDRDRSIGFRVLRTLDDQTPEQMKDYWLPDNEELRHDVLQRIGWRDTIGPVQPAPIDWPSLKFPFGNPEQ